MVKGADLTNLKTIIYGGAPMYLADLEEALGVFGPRLAQIYGQGETPMTITALSKRHHAEHEHPDGKAHLGRVGTVRTDLEVRVVDDFSRFGGGLVEAECAQIPYVAPPPGALPPYVGRLDFSRGSNSALTMGAGA